MKKISSRLRKIGLIIGVLLAMVALPVMVPQLAGAQANEQALCQGSGGVWSGTSCTTPGSSRTVSSTIAQVGNILIFIVGAVSVLMLIIGGLRYTLSAGDQTAITSAKNTILYAIVGIIIAVASYGIVNFVIRNL